MRGALVAVIVACAVGCEADPIAPPPTDASSTCASDDECTDGEFCTGVERCAPGDPAADADGCLPSAGDPCTAPRTCEESTDACVDCAGSQADGDGDGDRSMACGGMDCDDGDAARASTMSEVCDAADVDEDCDPTTFGTRDADVDGYVDSACCNGALCGDDCDDASASSSPEGAELCDSMDNDCDDAIDEGAGDTYYLDSDGDMYGVASSTMVACALPAMYAVQPDDCDDDNSARNPGLAEICDLVRDNDCDDTTNDFDADGDGHDRATCGGDDCDDASSLRHPGLGDPCDGLDADCDGSIEDADGDMHAAPGATCVGGFPADDCDDALPGRHPGHAEVCDTIPDNDCDPSTHPFDADGDGYDTVTCAGGTDCNDAMASIHPGAVETCDGVDANCDLAIEDADGDMHSPAGAPCSGGYPRDDCEDARADIYSGAVEICDGDDNDCDATDDDGAAASCPVRPNATPVCAPGGCTISCLPGFFDCAGGTTDGCEVAESIAACGNCTTSCTGVGTSCDASTCSTIVDVASGAEHTCIVRSNGRVVCWGANDAGQLGRGTVGGPQGPAVVAGLSNAVSVTAGLGHTCVVTSSGGVTCWGRNDAGQLGIGSTSTTPTAVPTATTLSAIAEVAAGARFTCARRTSGTVVCWGVDSHGQLGSGVAGPIRNAPGADVPGVSGATAIAAGSLHACAVRSGQVVCWGQNTEGQVGTGAVSPTAGVTVVAGTSGAVQVGAGVAFTCARSSGGVTCWGANLSGQLGNGTFSTRSLTAVGVIDAAGATVTDAIDLSLGDVHACVLRGGAQPACWGEGDFGRLGSGDGTTDVARATTVVAPGTDALDTGRAFACATTSGERVRCWGANAAQQLGDGTTTNRTMPVFPTGL